MHYRFALAGSILALALALLTVSSPAHADGRTEAAARQLETKAMQEDYLATDFDKALEKLNQAAGKCGTEKCSSIVRAQIKRDIGIVQIGKQNREAAVAAFTEALRADSNVQLDPDTRTKEVDAAWAEAKKQATSSGRSQGGTQPSGDFTMQPAPETAVRTPLPIYGEYSGNETLAKVVLKFKGFGMGEWKTVEMKEMGKGWGIEVPCLDVVQGDFLYYVQGFNANNDPVATSGDRNNPYKTVVKPTVSGEGLHFPGKDPPKQCPDTGDCPPDFPGCKKPVVETPESTLKAEGQDCEENDQCQSGACGKDKTCAGGGGESSSKRRKFWIGIEGEADWIWIPSASQVCLLDKISATPVNTAGYYCTDPGGNDYPSRTNPAQNALISPTVSDKVQSGAALGNIRVMLSFDYAATANFMIGARLGYVLNAYPGQAAKTEGKAFAPIHAELRGTFVIGHDALAQKGLAPYVMVAAGVSQWSTQVGVTVVPTNPTKPGESAAVQAWNISGPGFGSLGGGLRYAFTPRAALLVGPRFTLAFGAATLFAISPDVGLQFGF